MVIMTSVHRLIGRENFHISLARGWLGVVFDYFVDIASFLSDAMATRYRVSDIEHYLDTI